MLLAWVGGGAEYLQDQYINHIMNETGATVVLKGGSCESSCSEEIPQPLHLFISADHPKSLDDARRLAENLLETIRSEFGGSRPPYLQPAVSHNLQQHLSPYQVSPYVATSLEQGTVHPYSLAQQLSVLTPGNGTMAFPQVAGPTSTSLLAANLNISRAVSSKVYSAVPPPKQLLAVDQTMAKSQAEPEIVRSDEGNSDSSVASSSESTSLVSTSLPTAALVPPSYSGYPSLSMPYATAVGQPFSQQSYGMYPQLLHGSQPYSTVAGSVSAYSGLYPHASPLQQVALALQRPLQQVPVTASCSASQAAPPAKSQNNMNQGQAEKQEKQRRKFRELPVQGKDPPIDQLPSMEEAGGKQHIMPPPDAIKMPPPPPRSRSPQISMGPPPIFGAISNFASQSPIPSSSSNSSAASRGMLPPLPKPMPSATTAITGAVASSSMPPPPPVTRTSASSPVEILAVEGIKLVEYEEDEDDAEVTDDDKTEARPYSNGKPFWAA